MNKSGVKARWIRVALKILVLMLWTSLLAGVVAALAFANAREKEVTCKKVYVSIYPIDIHFFNRQRVLEVIRKDLSSEQKLIGKTIEEINTPKFEKSLLKQPHIKEAEVYSDMNGVLSIRVKQRKPVLRIIRFDGTQYYLDEEGYKMPLSEEFTPHVPVASGNIFERYEKGDTVYSFVGNQLLRIATYVDKDPFLKALIEQIFVRADNELILVPKVGTRFIIFGDANELEKKFRKLLVFYREGLNRVGWNKYRILDIRFEGQVIGKK